MVNSSTQDIASLSPFKASSIRTWDRLLFIGSPDKGLITVGRPLSIIGLCHIFKLCVGQNVPHDLTLLSCVLNDRMSTLGGSFVCVHQNQLVGACIRTFFH